MALITSDCGVTRSLSIKWPLITSRCLQITQTNCSSYSTQETCGATSGCDYHAAATQPEECVATAKEQCDAVADSALGAADSGDENPAAEGTCTGVTGCTYQSRRATADDAITPASCHTSRGRCQGLCNQNADMPATFCPPGTLASPPPPPDHAECGMKGLGELFASIPGGERTVQNFPCQRVSSACPCVPKKGRHFHVRVEECGAFKTRQFLKDDRGFAGRAAFEANGGWAGTNQPPCFFTMSIYQVGHKTGTRCEQTQDPHMNHIALFSVPDFGRLNSSSRVFQTTGTTACAAEAPGQRRIGITSEGRWTATRAATALRQPGRPVSGSSATRSSTIR